MVMYGLLRIKNEARWIERVVRAIQPLCKDVLILDDHSTDGTQSICRKLGCIVFDSPFNDLHEARDKEFLLGKLWEHGAKIDDYVVMVDGDEELNAADAPRLKTIVEQGIVDCGSFKVLYLWDSEKQIRIDRWYRDVRRATVFKLRHTQLSFMRTEFGGNLHCSSAPQELLNTMTPLPVHLIHYGYMHREDRIRKFYWYNTIDPKNVFEDEYRHMVVGDLFPASTHFKWAGPLELVQL